MRQISINLYHRQKSKYEQLNQNTLSFELLLTSPFLNSLKGKILLKGRRISDKKEDYYQGSAFDTDSDDDSAIEDEHTTDRDDKPVSSFCYYVLIGMIKFTLY
jgi:hypothetical protein